MFRQFATLPCARIAVDLGLFSKLSSGPKTAAQLADATGADELLIGKGVTQPVYLQV